MRQNLTLQTVIAATALALTACGGGGSSAPAPAPAPVVPAPTPPAPPPAPPVPAPPPVAASQPAWGASSVQDKLLPTTPTTTFTASKYTPGSAEDLFYNDLNTRRIQCGFGGLNQNTKLDGGAAAGAKYLAYNMDVFGHNQVPGRPFYTEVDGRERVAATGYVGRATEVLSGAAWAKPLAQVNESERLLAALGLYGAPYHLAAMLRGWRDVGIGIWALDGDGKNGYAVGQSFATAVVWPALESIPYTTAPGALIPVDYLSQTEQQPGQVLTYPCQGSTGVYRILSGENPDPIKNAPGWTYPTGPSIYVRGSQPLKYDAALGRYVQTLIVQSWTVTKLGSSIPLTSILIDSKSDANKNVLENEAHIYLRAPLERATTYQVYITGMDGDNPFTRQFTFTTDDRGDAQ